MTRAGRGHFVFFAATFFLAVPFAASSDFSVTVEPTLFLENAGIDYEGFEGSQDDYAPTVALGDDISSPSDTWTVTFLDPPAETVPSGRGVYVWYRAVEDPTPENGPDGDILISGQNYELVHAPIPGATGDATTSSETVSFGDVAEFGNPDTPAGLYSLFVFSLPETKEVYDAETDSLVEEPYTDADLIKWFEWNYGATAEYTGEIPDTYAPDSIDGFDFSYTARTAPLETPGITAPVIIIPGILGSQYLHGQWVIDPVLHVYDNLIDTLLANGYENGTTLFTFPYEWRNSNIQTALLLKDKIAEVKSICGCKKVDIVAHSMGGLIAREYMESAHYDDDVRRVVFIGTPHLGAPEDYLMWEAGKVYGNFLSGFFEAIFSGEAIEHGYLSLFDYIRNKPIYSVQELLPIYDYLTNADETGHASYSDGYPRNIFLEQLDANKGRLSD
jgi:pimeloyl-ACP methyl ester carboxylesterase